MASTRTAFNVLEQRSTNENTHIGKTPLAGKNENRAPFKVALKDLTNSTSRPTFPGKQQQDGPTGKKPVLLQKSTPSSSSSLLKKQQKQLTVEVPQQQQSAVVPPKKPAAPFIFTTPQDAEYGFGKRACLREDLLEQMIEFTGVSYARKIRPMKPLRVAPVQLPEFELKQRGSGETKPKKVKEPVVAKELPLFSLPVMDIPDLDFLL